MDPIVLSDEEALELHRFTQFMYINVTIYPHLRQLLSRVDGYMRAKEVQ